MATGQCVHCPAPPSFGMAFAQLTYRESLRDIEACLSAQAGKLYHMGFRDRVHRSTLADANEARDWRIYAEFAQRLIGQARRLYAGDDLGVDLSNTVYALDSTTIDLCLSVFPWAHFRSTKGAADGPDRGADLRSDHRARWSANRAEPSKDIYGASASGRGDRQDADFLHQPGDAAGPDDLRPLQKPMASGAVLQMDQAASAHQAVLRHLGKRGEDEIWIAVLVYALVAIVRKRLG